MNTQRIVTLGLVFVFLSSDSLLAQESKSSSWWPFGRSTKESTESETRTSSFFGASKSGGSTSGSTSGTKSGSSMFKLPSWSKSKSKSKSSVSKMGSTTKKWMSNTADFLNPFNDAKPKAAPLHGYETDYWTNRNKPKEKESSGRFGWMWKEEEEPKISSVNDFLKQPMPD